MNVTLPAEAPPPPDEIVDGIDAPVEKPVTSIAGMPVSVSDMLPANAAEADATKQASAMRRMGFLTGCDRPGILRQRRVLRKACQQSKRSMIGVMKILLFAAPILSLLVLAAHFLREGGLLLVVACIALMLLLAWRRPWVPRVVQAALALGTLEWLRTAVILVQERMADGRP
ncbi:MAG TPA: hypothetical protein VFP36_09635, partial [Usitatibacter sp.]|nr:hypothetical protein [Usitatibacter sp.]